jgi:hypothetical protein
MAKLMWHHMRTETEDKWSTSLLSII